MTRQNLLSFYDDCINSSIYTQKEKDDIARIIGVMLANLGIELPDYSNLSFRNEGDTLVKVINNSNGENDIINELISLQEFLRD